MVTKATKRTKSDPRTARIRKLLRTSTWRLFFIVLGVIAAIVLVVGTLAYQHYANIANRFDLNELGAMPERSVVYDLHHEVLGKLHGVNRTVVPLEKVSPYFINALIAREDAEFFIHNGIHTRGVARAALRNFSEKNYIQGASTLTMQLARNSYGLEERSMHRKVVEAILSRRIENHYSKSDILAAYMNRVFFGTGIYGIESAAQAYFGKSALDLNLPEGAMLAGILRAPNRFSPFRHQEAADREKNTVLDRMLSEGYISPEQAGIAKGTTVTVLKAPFSVAEENYTLDAVRKELNQILGKHDIKDGGWRIFTTLDSQLQHAAEDALESGLSQIETLPGYAHPTKAQFDAYQQPPFPTPNYLQGALLAIDNRTGGIRAMAGGRDYRHSQFNRALQARRQIGSLFKAFTYACAFDMGLTPGTLISDDHIMPGEISQMPPLWNPKNSDEQFLGWLPVEEGLIHSRNTMAIRVGNFCNLTNVLSLAERCGLSREIPHSPHSYLGTFETTLKTITSAYTVFPNQGVRRRTHLIDRIEDRHGNVVYEANRKTYQAISTASAYLVDRTLKEVVNRGTAKRIRQAQYEAPVAGKTGTTNNYHDAWFAGYSDKITCGVWLGLDRPAPIIDKGYGGRLALPIWLSFMQIAEQYGYPCEAQITDVPLTELYMCRHSARRATMRCQESGNAVIETLPNALIPQDACGIQH